MSLFQCREWWAASASEGDAQVECDGGGLCVANIDNEAKGGDKIITGSFSGVLRIYYPRQAGYKIDDLMLEMQLDQPILQLEAGRFCNSQKLSLAVLHPLKFVVYNVVGVGGHGKAVGGSSAPNEHITYYDINKAYEHKLNRTAFNLCYGPFGGVYNKDFICVQSMDGQLSFFEHETHTFSRFLHNYYLPSPLCYVPKLDSFVLVNTCMEVECYKYQVLGAAQQGDREPAQHKRIDEEDEHDAHAQHAINKAKSQNNANAISCDWSINLGENIVDIRVARYSRSLAASQVDILVLGEHTLFTLKEQGSIRLQKRIDYNPAACMPYNNTMEKEGKEDVGGSNQNLLIASHQKSLMIYKDTQLIWAARTQSIPVALRVGTFNNIRGLIVQLSDTCDVSISYLGSDPPVHGLLGVPDAANVKELDYERMDEEHRNLLKTIKQANTDSLVEPKELMSLRAQVSSHVTMEPEPMFNTQHTRSKKEEEEHEEFNPDTDDNCVKDERGFYYNNTLRLYVSYNGKDDLENVNITISCCDGLKTPSKSILLPTVKGSSSTPLILPIAFRPSRTVLPSTLSVDIVAAYVTSNQEPRTAKCTAQLPITLVAKAVQPLKNCQYMFTLDTNRNPPALTDIFQDVLSPAIASSPELARTAANVLSIAFLGVNCDVTILVSKKSGRYRLQSGVFEALSMITQQLVQRLTKYYQQADGNSSSEPPFQVLFKELLPLHDYFSIIDKHFNLRLSLNTLRSDLERVAHQLRVIQKRLLVRYKDKNPAPLNHLDTIMHETYDKMGDVANKIQREQKQLFECQSQLSCATFLIILLIRFKYDLDASNSDLLLSHFSPFLSSSVDPSIGWEEYVDAAMTHLLRTALAKNAKEAAGTSQAIQPLKDCTKLKRHIQIVCERLAKGMRLTKRDVARDAPAEPTATRKRDEHSHAQMEQEA